MPPAIPQYDLAMLITLDIGLALLGLLLTFFAALILLLQLQRNARESREDMRVIAEIARDVATMAHEILRRTG